MAVIGAAETTDLGVIPHMSSTQLHINAAINAMADANIRKDHIDGIACTINPGSLAHYLGIVPR